MAGSELFASRLALVHADQPLYERVPTRDEHGQFLGDFMMLLPGLRDQPQHELRTVLGRVNAALEQFAEVVVFAELNVPLNLLWVSVKPRPGIILDIAACIKLQVPEALIVGTEYQ